MNDKPHRLETTNRLERSSEAKSRNDVDVNVLLLL